MSRLEDVQYKRLFKAAPDKTLVVRPENFEIVDVTQAYLQATMTRESDILGKTLFEVFPRRSDEPKADGANNLQVSLQRVLSLKVPDTMGVQRYLVRQPNGTFEERFWSSVNTPVLDETGNVEFVMHRVEDVTSIIRERDAVLTAPSRDSITLHDMSQALGCALSKLQEYQARMHTAERLLHLGAWEFNIQTEQLNWSQPVFDIYDVPVSQTSPNLEDYFAIVHPEDREATRNRYAAFAEQGASQIEFEHRVITHDKQVKYIKGVGERLVVNGVELVVGFVLDTTPLRSTQHKLTYAEYLLRLAGKKAQLGGWRVDLDSETSIWTPETAAIHGMPDDYSPASVDEAIQFYAPAYRDMIKDAFEQCAQRGEEFDLVCQLAPPDGRRPWVRAIGMAEKNAQGRIIAVQGAFQDITVLHDAQSKAEEAEKQRLNVLESISDGFLAIDRNWNFTYANQQAGSLLGRPRDDLLGKNLWQEYPETVGSELEREYRMAVEEQQTTRFQYYYSPLEMWLDISAYPIPTGLAVYFRDVTRDRESQQQLRLVEAALSRQNDTVIITEADVSDSPRIVYVNDAFERMTGYTKSEAIGRTPAFLQGPETDREQLDLIHSALNKRESVRCELLNYSKSGATYWLELDITPLFDEVGRCSHFVSVQRDITRRKQQEQALRQAQERFQLISRATNDVIWDWNLLTNNVWWNDAMTDVFGYPLSELEPGPESWTHRIHPEDLASTYQSIHDVIEGKDEYWSSEYRFIKRDGQSANVIDRGYLVRNETGKATRMVGSMLDITERIGMEERLRESQKLEAVGHLTGGVAHDFNNLLTVILGNAEMLVELADDPHLRPMAAMTLSAAQRGAELTNRLLAFSRRQPLDPKLTDLNKLVEAMQALIRRTLPESIELEFVPAPDLGIVEVDAGELDTALLNLVVNARDAMQQVGKLTIETANAVLDHDYASRHTEVLPGEYVMICVSDTGNGMDAKTLHRAFEPFFTTKSGGKGSGLGLSMVFGFTKQSDGHIKLYSEPGEGTSVKLYFPRVRGAQQSHHHAVLENQPRGGKEHILIAEDDDLVLRHLEGQLRLLGYRVTAVNSGPNALEALHAQPDVDLLLTDIIMPGGMNGRELADKARATYPSLKVLFTSGYTENAIVHHGRLDPGVDLLSKPYTRLELSIKVRKVLDITKS